MSKFQDSFCLAIDSTSVEVDSIVVAQDTLLLKEKKRLSIDALTSSVKYISQDSIIINLKKKQILLFEAAKANYEDIELTAAYMEFGFVSNELYASGIADSCGHIHGAPLFKQGETEFSSQEIKYNFVSKKGKVTKVITTEGEGYVHGYYVKHVDEKVSYIKGGQYTTCNLEHAHFQIRFNKGKVVQDDKIVTGPAYLSFGNVPSPIVLPFTFFPLNKERGSGIILPSIGESQARGFYFDNFGYYLGINDHIDLLFSGDISTRGSWAAKAKSNYAFRYKCNGLVELGFAQKFFGERDVLEGNEKRTHNNDFSVKWDHNQDPKSHPTTRFSAHVNVISSTYNKYNPSSTSDYLSNQFTSSVNLSTNASGIFFFDAALYYNQNTRDRSIGISLPDINMSVRQFYPFRKKLKFGKLKWYDNISMKWNSQASNRINTFDTLFFKPQTWKELQTGIKHSIPVTMPIKLGKSFNWNTNATLVEKWYLQSNERFFDTDTVDEKVNPTIYDVFKRGFYALHDLSIATSLTTKIYFTYSYKKGVLKGRHVMSPDINFTYRPNLNGNTNGTYFNTITGKDVEYSYFNYAMFGTVESRTQAITRFTLNNNLELLVRSKKDTINGTRKLPIFDNLSISCGYDFAADSLNWLPLTITGRSSFLSFFNVTFRLSFDPYVIMSDPSNPNAPSRRVNQRELEVNNRLMRFSGSDLSVGINWRINRDMFRKKKNNEHTVQETQEQPQFYGVGAPNRRTDFTNPWNITLNYTFQYLTSENLQYYSYFVGKKYNSNLIQTININGDVNITRKWKVGFATGYDIQNKDILYTSIDIYRDLHCWEMSFHWIPFGYKKEWRFQINVKAQVLQDLKLKTEKSFIDNIF